MLSSTETQRFVAARRAVIALDFKGLNAMQQQAVMATEGPLLVLAGAGSGKTTVLIRRIENIIKYGRATDSDEVPDYITPDDVAFLERFAASPNEAEREAAERLCELDPAAPWTVIAITFTNKAAGEMKERLAKRLGPRADEVWASTFHSACVRILRRDIERLGYSRDFTIYDSADSERVMKDIVNDLRLDDNVFAPRVVLKAVSEAKDRMIFPADYEAAYAHENAYRASKIAAAYSEYAKRLKKANAVDFDDLLLLTVQLFQTCEDVKKFYQRKFKYVLIDEYQDTNNLQYLFAKTLAGEWRNLCVVGDDDQSIYRFRGATVENILMFEKQFNEVRVVKLEENYRSTSTILKAANGVIGNNVGRKGKSLWTQQSGGDKLTVYAASDDGDEAHYIARTVLERVAKGGKFGDAAVLYRMNAQMNRVEDAFKRSGVPYRVIGGTRFFDRAEIKDMLAYLHLINNHTDDLRLSRIINVPVRGIGGTTVNNVASIAVQTGLSMYDVIKSAHEFEALGRPEQKLKLFIRMIDELTKLSQTASVSELYDAVIDKTGYIRALEEKEQSEPEVRTRIENVLELKSNIVAYEYENDEPSLAGFLDEISLFTDIDRYDTDADAVILMTMHAAKGLEFPEVFIIGLEEGMFPGTRALGFTDELEEERRLCYVAITRARERLSMCYAKRRMIFGRTSFNPPSRFLDELPPECVQEKRSEFLSAPSVRDDLFAPQTRYVAPSAPRRKSPPPPPKMKLNPGDSVKHTAFGVGMVVSIKPMGGDALLEIAFNEGGTKRLMLNTAVKFMEKL